MDKSQLAIMISVASVLIAGFSLGWNIYRDIILKAKVVVTIGVKRIAGGSLPMSPPYVGIQATNHGPGPIILNTIVLKNTSLWKKLTKKQSYAVLNHDYTNQYSGSLPKKLEVGETINLFVNYDKDCFLKEEFTQLGISDSFGRTNWSSKKLMAELRGKWVNEFKAST